MPKKVRHQPLFIFAERKPLRSELDTMGRVLAWDGAAWVIRSTELLDDRDIWCPLPKVPGKRILARSAKIDKKPPNPLG